MADGLEKMVGILQQRQQEGPQKAHEQAASGGASAGETPVDGGANGVGRGEQMPAEEIYNLGAVGQLDMSTMNLDPNFLMETSMGMDMGMGLDGTPEQPFFGDEFGFGQGLM